MKTLTRKEWEERINKGFNVFATFQNSPDFCPQDTMNIRFKPNCKSSHASMVSKNVLLTTYLEDVMWVPVEEALPEEESRIDMWDGNRKYSGNYSFSKVTNKYEFYPHNENRYDTITHWTYPILPEVK